MTVAAIVNGLVDAGSLFGVLLVLGVGLFAVDFVIGSIRRSVR